MVSGGPPLDGDPKLHGSANSNRYDPQNTAEKRCGLQVGVGLDCTESDNVERHGDMNAGTNIFSNDETRPAFTR